MTRIGLGYRTACVSLILVASAVAACGGSGTTTTAVRLLPPDAVVRGWLAAVDSAGAESLAEMVHAEPLAFVIAIESRLEPADVVTMLDEGIPAELEQGYWRSLSDSFLEIGGRPLSDLAVGTGREVGVSGATFSAVTVGDRAATAEILVRRSVDGAWRVDMLATVGPGLSGQLLDLAGQAAPDRLRTAFEQWVIPALEAAASDDPEDGLLVTVREIRIALNRASG